MTEIHVQKHSRHKEIASRFRYESASVVKNVFVPGKLRSSWKQCDTVAEDGVLRSTAVAFQFKMIGQVTNLWLTKFQTDQHQDIQTHPTRVIRRLG